MKTISIYVQSLAGKKDPTMEEMSALLQKRGNEAFAIIQSLYETSPEKELAEALRPLVDNSEYQLEIYPFSELVKTSNHTIHKQLASPTFIFHYCTSEQYSFAQQDIEDVRKFASRFRESVYLKMQEHPVFAAEFNKELLETSKQVDLQNEEPKKKSQQIINEVKQESAKHSDYMTSLNAQKSDQFSEPKAIFSSKNASPSPSFFAKPHHLKKAAVGLTLGTILVGFGTLTLFAEPISGSIMLCIGLMLLAAGSYHGFRGVNNLVKESRQESSLGRAGFVV